MTPAKRKAALRLADMLETTFGPRWAFCHEAAALLRELAAEPQQRKPLTDEQIDLVLGSAYRALAASGYTGGMGSTQWDHAAARAIERAHGITGEQK